MLEQKIVKPYERTRLEGAVDVAATFLDDGLTMIAGVYTAIVRELFPVLRLAPGVAGASEMATGRQRPDRAA